MSYQLILASSPTDLHLLVSLFVILGAAKVLGELFERLHQPSVVGEILAGVLIGPSMLGWVSPSETTTALAEIGVIFLLFNVGLETKPSAVLSVGKSAAFVAVLGVLVPFAGGWGVMHLWGSSHLEALFVGTALVATSVGITARVLSDCGVLNSNASRIILGAAVIDDILGLLVLAIVSSLAANNTNYWDIAITAALAFAFTGLVAFVGAPVLSKLRPVLQGLRLRHSFFVAALIICLGLSVAASYIGIAAIIGAFLAGTALAEAAESDNAIHTQTTAVTEFLVPFFLVNIGMQLKLEVFREPGTLWLALVVTVVAVITKLVGCGAGVWALGARTAAQVGVGMIPRGEVGIIVAQLGLGLGIIGDSLFAVVLFMAVATTLVAPPFLRVLFRPARAA